VETRRRRAVCVASSGSLTVGRVYGFSLMNAVVVVKSKKDRFPNSRPAVAESPIFRTDLPSMNLLLKR
jgi:hypothetical protein